MLCPLYFPHFLNVWIPYCRTPFLFQMGITTACCHSSSTCLSFYTFRKIAVSQAIPISNGFNYNFIYSSRLCF